MTFSCREKTSRWVLHVHSVLRNDGRLIGTCCCCSLRLSRQNSKGTTFCQNVRNCGYSARNKGGIVLNVWNIAFFSFTIPRESVLDEFFLLLVMFFFACLFVFEDWQTYTDGWSRTRIGRIQKVTMLVFLSCFFFFWCEYIFFLFCVFLFLFLEQIQILRASVSYLHNLLLNSSRFFMSLCEHGCVLFNVNDPFRKCWSFYLDIRFCMNLTPLERRERIPVNVNLKGLLNGRKNGST